MDQEGIPFAQAVAGTLREGGLEVLDDPYKFMSYLYDMAGDEVLEMRVLTSRCDNELLDIYKDAATAKDVRKLSDAAARAADLLISQYVVADEAAKKTAQGIAQGIALWSGVRATTHVSAPAPTVDPEAMGLVHFGALNPPRPLNGYVIKGELSAKNAGLSRWGSCTRDGREYYIKEFLAPVYPIDQSGLTPAAAQRKRLLCEQFFQQKRELYRRLALCQTGNIVTVKDFFRDKAKYYAVTDWVQASGLSFDEVARLDTSKKVLLTREILFNVAMLHSYGIVHADLKPDNLLLRHTKNGYVTAKLIDFDGSFLIGETPADIQGDLVYLAPEAYRKMNGEDVAVSEKIDVFALGVIIHRLWAGRAPAVGGPYQYVWEAALNGAPIHIDQGIPGNVGRVIMSMLQAREQDRPIVAAVFQFFSKVERVLR